MNVVVHIGMEKTGSTTLQEILHLNRVVLEQQGYYFLRSPGLKNNRMLPAYCMRDDRVDEFFDHNLINTQEKRSQWAQSFMKELDREIKMLPPGIHTVIISSEHFHSRLIYEDEVSKLKNILMNYFTNIKIISYLRKQVDAAISLYSTALRNGETLKFREFISRNCNVQNPYFNYFEYLSRWETVFFDSAVLVKIFERNAFSNRSLANDFVSSIGAELVSIIDGNIPVQNESLNSLSQCLIRLINTHFPWFAEGIGFNKINIELTRAIISCGGDQGEDLDDAIYEDIQSQFSVINEKVRKKYFMGRTNLFEERKERKSGVSINEIQEEILNNLLRTFASLVYGEITETFVDQLRDVAVTLEGKDLRSAYQVMTIAGLFRPSGPLIKEKIAQYKLALNAGC